MVDKDERVQGLLNLEECPSDLERFLHLLDELDIDYDTYSADFGMDGEVTRVTVYDTDDESILICYYVSDRLVRTVTL